MKQEYFVLVLAHSLRGRLRRVHIPHQAVYAILALALLGCFSLFGFVASYARMAWKVANYNALRREADALRTRYRNLQNVVSERNQELASLQMLAKEVQLAYGIKQKIEGPADISAEGKLGPPTFAESLEDYHYLRAAATLGLAGRNYRRLFPLRETPSIWPVEGRLMSGYAMRQDPFSGEGEFHKGVDISAITGTAVRVTADGTVIFSGRSSGYGNLVIVDHGNNIHTYYAHLSKKFVQPGQEVRRGDVVGAVGSTGRVTAPHLHYEVRLSGAAVNPYPYLAKAGAYRPAPKKDFLF